MIKIAKKIIAAFRRLVTFLRERESASSHFMREYLEAKKQRGW